MSPRVWAKVALLAHWSCCELLMSACVCFSQSCLYWISSYQAFLVVFAFKLSLLEKHTQVSFYGQSCFFTPLRIQEPNIELMLICFICDGMHSVMFIYTNMSYSRPQKSYSVRFRYKKSLEVHYVIMYKWDLALPKATFSVIIVYVM